MYFFHPIQQSAAHVYHSALPLSPESSVLRSTLLRDVRIAEFYGRPDSWGPVVRTIKATVGRITCMATVGRGIAAACDDGTVSVYDSTTGALRVSLSPEYPTEAVRGSPDGSILFCTHRASPSITLWDIQTGGLIHTFALASQVNDTAVSLNGRYLSCGLPDGSIRVWEVAKRAECSAFGIGWPVLHLCWLAPEERLAIVDLVSLYIFDVVARTVIYTLRVPDSVCDTAYSRELDQLAIMTSSGSESTITVIDPRTGVSSVPCRIRQQLSCFAFSQTTKELVCGIQTHGLYLFNTSMADGKQFDHPAKITSVSTLSNGTIVVNAAGFGIQLLNLDSGYPPSGQPIEPRTVVLPIVGEEGIVEIAPATYDYITLLEAATMRQLITIPGSGSFARNRTVCASLANLVAVFYCVQSGKMELQLWRFGNELPEWTMRTDEPPSVARISPAGTRLVIYCTAYDQNHVRIYDTRAGEFLAELPLDRRSPLLDITFDLDDRFFSHHNTRRIPYVLATRSVSDGFVYSISRQRPLPPAFQQRRWPFFLDNSEQWVVSGSQRICWIPPGYIGSLKASFCWAGNSLIMAGQDGILRMLTFR